jgi:hypothetical protein
MAKALFVASFLHHTIEHKNHEMLIFGCEHQHIPVEISRYHMEKLRHGK